MGPARARAVTAADLIFTPVAPKGTSYCKKSGGDVCRPLQLGYFILQFQLLALDGRDLGVTRGGVRHRFREFGFKRRMLCKKFTEGW